MPSSFPEIAANAALVLIAVACNKKSTTAQQPNQRFSRRLSVHDAERADLEIPLKTCNISAPGITPSYRDHPQEKRGRRKFKHRAPEREKGYGVKHTICFFFLLALFAPATGRTQQPEQTIADLVRGSHVIFVGRAVKQEAVNLKALKPSANTVVVRVEELLDAPPALAGLKNQDVTLETLRPGSLRAGQRAVFFTNGILFGEHLEVKEVGQLPAPADTASIRKQIATVRGQIDTEKLQARVQTAVLIVSGKVLEVKSLKRPARSEHDPEWAEATIQIQSVQKGSHDGRTITIYFPASTDERWYLAPKFHAEEQGIWLLHQEQNLDLPQGSLTALSPLDFQPLEKEPAIRALVR